MNILELIESIENFDDEAIVFAELVDGKFTASSTVEVVLLSDEELSLPTSEVAKNLCSGKTYFMEVFLIKEMVSELQQMGSVFSFENACERIISYAVNDA